MVGVKAGAEAGLEVWGGGRRGSKTHPATDKQKNKINSLI